MAEGIFMIVLPMPLRLKHVNIFVFLEEGGFSLIDTGPNLPGVMEALEASVRGLNANIRKLVEEARRVNEGRDRVRRAQEAAYRFMSATAGNQPGFEEAARLRDEIRELEKTNTGNNSK